MGCLRRSLGILGCLVLVAGAALLAWMYRDRLTALYHRLRGAPRAAPAVYAPGAPGAAAKADSALRRLSRRGGPAYVDLTAAELASLIDQELDGARRVLDSVAVSLGNQRVQVRGSLDVSALPHRLLGPLAEGLGRREPVMAGGALSVARDGRVVWTIDELKIRDFPFPTSVIPSIIEALGLPSARGAAVPIPLPPGIGDVRVNPAGVRAYRASPR